MIGKNSDKRLFHADHKPEKSTAHLTLSNLWQNYLPNVFPASPIDVVVFKCREICPTGNRRNRVLFPWPKNKISAPSQTVATARIVPKIR